MHCDYYFDIVSWCAGLRARLLKFSSWLGGKGITHDAMWCVRTRTCFVNVGHYSVDKAAFVVKIGAGKVGFDLFLILEAGVWSRGTVRKVGPIGSYPDVDGWVHLFVLASPWIYGIRE